MARPFDTPGGAQSYLLTKENMPPLFLKFHTAQSGPGITLSMVDDPTFDKPASQPFLETSKAPVQAFSVMPPYIAVYFCRKSSQPHERSDMRIEKNKPRISFGSSGLGSPNMFGA
jgi:hypothetical protein